MSRGKQFVIYCRQTLDSHDLIEAAFKWAKKRRITVVEVILDGNLKQKRLAALLRENVHRNLICPNLFHFAEPSRIVHRIAEAQRLGWTLHFAQENIALQSNDKSRTFFDGLLNAEKMSRVYQTRRSLMLAKICDGKRLGKPPLLEAVQDEAVSLLKQGKGIGEVVRAMDGRISRTSVQILRNKLKE